MFFYDHCCTCQNSELPGSGSQVDPLLIITSKFSFSARKLACLYIQSAASQDEQQYCLLFQQNLPEITSSCLPSTCLLLARYSAINTSAIPSSRRTNRRNFLMTSLWMSTQESCSQSWQVFWLDFSSIYAKEYHSIFRGRLVQVHFYLSVTPFLC